MHRSQQTIAPDRHLVGERETARRRRVRAAAWRALALARSVFGPGVGLRLRPAGGTAPPSGVVAPHSGVVGGGRFAGILHLHVPFRDARDHRLREDVFVAAAGRDPLLSRTHLVFVFTPVPDREPGSRPAETA